MSGGYTKREILDAVVGALRPLSVQGGGYVRQLESVGLDEPARDIMDGPLGLPAVLVSFSSSTYSPGQYLHLRETVGFEVTVVLLGGSGRDPEAVLADVRGLLGGSTLGLDLGPVTPLRESRMEAGVHRTAYTALYSVAQSVPMAG